MKIVPALLAEHFDDFEANLKKAERFADYVQIDLMDGVFVPTRSFAPEMLNSLQTPLAFEVHLMVRDALEAVTRLTHRQLRSVIFHVESQGDHEGVISAIRATGRSVGLAFKPETGLDEAERLRRHIDTLLFLTVYPFCYGNPFRPEVLDKVRKARLMFPDKTISVDGGVSLENVKMFREVGVDSVCVGSRIFLTKDPEESYRLFVSALQGSDPA
jgi:ribulose-phosphate 3-epimerase